MPNLTDVVLPKAFKYKNDVSAHSTQAITSLRIDISQALKNCLEKPSPVISKPPQPSYSPPPTNDDCCSVLSLVSPIQFHDIPPHKYHTTTIYDSLDCSKQIIISKPKRMIIHHPLMNPLHDPFLIISPLLNPCHYSPKPPHQNRLHPPYRNATHDSNKHTNKLRYGFRNLPIIQPHSILQKRCFHPFPWSLAPGTLALNYLSIPHSILTSYSGLRKSCPTTSAPRFPVHEHSPLRCQTKRCGKTDNDPSRERRPL